MKKLGLLIVVLVAVWLGVNYFKTGRITLVPEAASAEEQQLRDLEQELASVNSQIAQSGRAAGMTGMDTTADVAGLMMRKEKLEKQVAEARLRTHR